MDWKKYKMEMGRIIKIFKEISEEKGARLLIDEKDWPSVSLEWEIKDWKKKLQFFLKDNRETYSLTGYRSKGEHQADRKVDIYKLLSNLRYPFSDIDKEQLVKYFEQISHL